MTMMKKLLVLAVLAIGFTACEKEDTDAHCWRCEWMEYSTDDKGIVTTKADSTFLCQTTPQQIKIYEERYKQRTLLNTTYTDRKCTQIADTTQKK
jgi:hypothetical protein